MHLSYSKDDRYVAATTCRWTNALVICDATTGDVLCNYSGFPNILVYVDFSYDGKHLATVDSEENVAVFNFPTLQEIMNCSCLALNGRELTPEEIKSFCIE